MEADDDEEEPVDDDRPTSDEEDVVLLDADPIPAIVVVLLLPLPQISNGWPQPLLLLLLPKWWWWWWCWFRWWCDINILHQTRHFVGSCRLSLCDFGPFLLLERRNFLNQKQNTTIDAKRWTDGIYHSWTVESMKWGRENCYFVVVVRVKKINKQQKMSRRSWMESRFVCVYNPIRFLFFFFLWRRVCVCARITLEMDDREPTESLTFVAGVPVVSATALSLSLPSHSPSALFSPFCSRNDGGAAHAIRRPATDTSTHHKTRNHLVNVSKTSSPAANFYKSIHILR